MVAFLAICATGRAGSLVGALNSTCLRLAVDFLLSSLLAWNKLRRLGREGTLNLKVLAAKGDGCTGGGAMGLFSLSLGDSSRIGESKGDLRVARDLGVGDDGRDTESELDVSLLGPAMDWRAIKSG